MKYLGFFLLLFIISSCSDVSQQDITDIEFLLGTDLNVEYEIANIETPFDFADWIISFDLKFNKTNFDSLYKKIDIDKFENIEFTNLDGQNRFIYYREDISEEIRVYLSIDTTNNSIHYSSQR